MWYVLNLTVIFACHNSEVFPWLFLLDLHLEQGCSPWKLKSTNIRQHSTPGELARRLWLLRLPDNRPATIPKLFYDTIQIATQGPRYDILLCGTRIVPIASGWTRREAREAGMVCFFLVPNTNRLKVDKIKRLGLRQWLPKFSFYHMSLYHNIAISGSNVDIPTLRRNIAVHTCIDISLQPYQTIHTTDNHQ